LNVGSQNLKSLGALLRGLIKVMTHSLPYRAGLDLGGTKIEGIVLDPGGREIYRLRVPTEQEKGYPHILRNLAGVYEKLAQKIGPHPHKVGIGTPGAISGATGLLKNSNTVCLNGKPLREDLRKMLARDIEIQNDANCFAMAEARLGAGKGKRLVFGVIMGTGCGGGIVHEGKVITGLQGIAGEWGHMSMDPAGPECYCGNRGCVETFISGGGLEKRYEREFGEKLPLREIVLKYRENDSGAAAFMNVFFGNFGRSLANVINILDPDVVILGGGVSNIDELYTKGIEEAARFVFTDRFQTPIVKHELGDSAGVIGAALIGT
jgi:fructokinase